MPPATKKKASASRAMKATQKKALAKTKKKATTKKSLTALKIARRKTNNHAVHAMPARDRAKNAATARELLEKERWLEEETNTKDEDELFAKPIAEA